MTRLLAALLALAAVVAADADDRDASRQARERAVAQYLAGDLEPLPLPESGPLIAAGAGPLSWFVPQVLVWFPALEGTLATPLQGGQLVDVDLDLALDDKRSQILPQIQFSIRDVGVRFSQYGIEFEGFSNASREFTFANAPFGATGTAAAGEALASRFEIDNLRLVLLIPISETGNFRMAIIAGLSHFEVEASILGAVTGSAFAAADLPMPVFGLYLQLRSGRFLLELDVAGFSGEVDDAEGDVLELQVSVGWTLWDVLGIRVGYRYIELDANDEDFAVDLTLDGFFVGASLEF